MNETEAREFRTGHDAEVKRLYKLTVAKLNLEYGRKLREHGREILFGGPARKDEFVSAIIELDYPIDQLNESIHVLYHKPGESWSACEWCHPHGGEHCDCKLGR